MATDPALEPLIAELRAVWGRRITKVDGDKRANSLPLELPLLDGYLRASPWSTEVRRSAALMALLKYSIAYVEASEEHAATRRQISLLFGLDPKWDLYSRDELSVKAQAGVPHLVRKGYETSREWTSRERTWRNRLYPLLAQGVRRYVAAGFKILPDEAHPFVLIPNDADLPPVTVFGRDSVIAQLCESSAHLRLVTGSPGVGKTAVAMSVLQTLAPRYPGGSVQIDMQGFGPGEPLSAAAVARAIVTRLGYSSHELPEDEAALLSVYRGVLADRELLVLLDNAADASVVRALLVPQGSATFLITSRRRLVALDEVGSVHVEELEPLRTEDASRMLRTLIADERVAREPADLDWLVQACQGLPYPLAILGGRLRGRPEMALQSVREDIERRRHPLHARLPNSEDSTQLIIDWSLNGLSSSAALTLYALVGLPIPHWEEEILRFLPIDGVGDAIEDLIDDHLVVEAPGPSLRPAPLVGWAVVEREEHSGAIEPRKREEIVREASDFVGGRIHSIHEGDLVRRFHMTNGYAYLANPRPLLPAGAVPEDDDEIQKALDNCQSLMYFAYHRRDPNALVVLAAGAHQVSLRRGDLRLAAESAHLWRQALMALRQGNSDEELGQVLQFYLRAMPLNSRSLALSLIRSGDERLRPYLAQIVGTQDHAEQVVGEIETLLIESGRDGLISELATAGDIPAIYVADDPVRTTPSFERIAQMEVDSLRATREDNHDQARSILRPMLETAWEAANKQGSVDLLWDFGPPLGRLARLESEVGKTETAIDALGLAARLYGSKGARGWSGLAREAAGSLLTE